MKRGKAGDGRNKQPAPDAKPDEKPAQRPDAREAGDSKPEKSGQEASAEEVRDLKREEYGRHIDLFQFYCDISLKANLYFYLITGGVTSFYFSALSRSAGSDDDPLPSPMRFIEVSFLLPIFMSGVLGGVFFYGRHLWLEVVESIEEIRDDLSTYELCIKKTPEVGLLASLLLIFGSLFFLVGWALTALVAVQMKNSKVWSTNNTWFELFSTPKTYLILLPAAAILVAGLVLPLFARRIDWAIKRLRGWGRRRWIAKSAVQLRKPKLDDPNYHFKDSFLYYRLRPHLSEETVRLIKSGIFPRSLIEEDIEKLKIKWGLHASAPRPSLESDRRP